MPELIVEVQEELNPSLARIVISGKWSGDVTVAKPLLLEACNKWPNGKVDCLITCGAFLNFDWPKSLTDIGDNKYPNECTIQWLSSEAQKRCDLLLSDEIRQELAKHTNYITIGVDSYKDSISLSNVSIKQLHAELVTLVDLVTNRYYWTGKSYPTPGQENGLVRFADLRTHFVEASFGKVMILGCHDLNVFNRRGKHTTKKEWRKKIREEFYDIVHKENPTIVLHHPHTTDSTATWTASWNELVKIAPTITRYISAGRYFNPDGECRSLLNDVLKKTKLCRAIDFIVKPY